MDNQHRLIKGYAELDQEKIDLLNEISRMGESLERLVEKVNARTKDQRSAAADAHDVIRKETHGGLAIMTDEQVSRRDAAVETSKALDYAQPERWAALARTELQTGLMFLKRAVAQPQLF